MEGEQAGYHPIAVSRLRCIDGSEALPLASRRALRWFDRRTYRREDLPPEAALAAHKRLTGVRVSVGIPALDEESTIGDICRTIAGRLVDELGLVDELVVIDGGSRDRTAAEARSAGARVVAAGDLVPAVPPVAGKGDALWRSLDVLGGDVVVWIDGDIRNFGSHFVSRLLAPLLLDGEIMFVKGFYSRPLELDGLLSPTGGGRVTELTARPLLCAFFPELAGFVQPLAGEYAGRRDAFRSIPFFSGYGVEAGMLIDLLDMFGLHALAQADLGERVHRNRPLEQLAPMAYAVGRAILRRAEDWGRIQSTLDYPSHPLLVPDEGRMDAQAVAELQRPPFGVISEFASRPAVDESAARTGRLVEARSR